MSDDIIRITDTDIDVQEIMRGIRRKIAEKRKDPEYLRRMALLEQAEKEDGSPLEMNTRLMDKMHLPPTHRKGFVGRIANNVLSKLFLATKSFMSGTLMTQERFNASTQSVLKRMQTELEEVHARHGQANLPSELFNYTEFENAFRGSEELIRARQEKYIDYFKGASVVLDIGCGRGEFLQLLKDKGIEGVGIDTNQHMVAHCIAKGLRVTNEDAVVYLKELKPESLGGVFASHVVEHVSSGYLISMLAGVYRAIEDGGVLICETPNPQSLSIFSNAFYIDPTHLRPVHPEELKFMFRSVGFREIEFLPLSELPDEEKLALLPTSGVTGEAREVLNHNIEKLNQIIYGPQDYAIIGRK